MGVFGCNPDNPMGVDTGVGDTGPIADTGPPRDTGLRDSGGIDSGRDGGGTDGGTDGGMTCTGADLCSTVGTTCTGTNLVTCAVATDGCMRQTMTDCSTTAGMVCAAIAGAPAACVDHCAHVPVADRCTAASRTCNAGTLDVCAMDAMGCFAMTHTNCTSAAGGSCDSSGSMPVCVSTANPCGGLTSCGTAMSRTCMGTTGVTICDANAAGCFVSHTTTCSGATSVCSASTGTAMCVDPCSLVTTCPSAMYCSGSAAVTCAADTNGCLVETGRTTCASGCSAGACAATACPASAANPVLTCASGMITGNTSTGTTMLTTYNASCSPIRTYPNHEMVYRFESATNARVTLAAVRGATATGDYDFFILDGGTGATVCDTAATCLAHDAAGGANENVTFDIQAGHVAWIAYDLFDTTTSDAPFTLTVSCVVPVCGDGVIGSGETCDDHNTTAGDGCSATCVIESGSVCYGTPSVCGPANTCGNGVRETGETCDDHNVAAGDGCSPTCAVEAGYSCTTAMPNVCTRNCGNGTLETGETCDDHNTTAGDGCSAACAVESGFVCEGSPSMCGPTATNGTCATATPVIATSTLSAQNSLGGGASPTGTGCGSTGGNTLYYSVTIPASTTVTVNVMPTAFDAVLKTEDACGAAACSARVDSGLVGGAETTMLVNSTALPITRIVAVNGFYSGTSTNPHGGVFSISFTYVAAVCGNGVLNAGEACDDSNMTNGDGCSSTCAVEAGYNCSGAPSVCIMQAANATCAGAAVLSPTGSVMGNVAAGGARPTGNGCTAAPGPALWYSITVPANSTSTVTATPTGAPAWDAVISRVTSCAAAGCSATRNSGANGIAEVLAFINATASPATYLFSVGSNSATVSGTVTVSATTAANTFTGITAACMDLSAQTPLTLASGDDDDGNTAVVALPFAFSLYGTVQMSYAISTNGFMQLFPGVTGTAIPAFGNADIPAAGTPNGFLAPFWDDMNGGTVLRSLVSGVAGSRVLVVEWRGSLFNDTLSTLRYQAMIYETTNVVEFHYCSMATTSTTRTDFTGAGATLGAEDGAGATGTRISFNTGAAATTGTGYRFTP